MYILVVVDRHFDLDIGTFVDSDDKKLYFGPFDCEANAVLFADRCGYSAQGPFSVEKLRALA